mmetsp:Transcript_30036/g.50843  ORF Transcript_30036/g.50843 Transcript_30036/m.50843 type:complete len:168 (+) Transcript_30036:348-851(+)
MSKIQNKVELWHFDGSKKFEFLKEDQTKQDFKQHGDSIISLGFTAPNRKINTRSLLMSASRDSTIRFWDYRGSKINKDKVFYCDFESKIKFQLGDFRGVCRFVPSRAPLFVDPNKPRKLNSDYKVIISGIEHLSQARRRGALVLVEFFDVHVHSDGIKIMYGFRRIL